ncbi:MAG: electron transport complex subunit RsxC [Clostridia bacterium]|nr:electron transport complex subunit RsxC [Clostridia bacterium]
MSIFKLGKTKVPHRKNTAGMPAVRVAPPDTVAIPVAQHIGAPATPVCKVGDEVFVGTVIAEAAGFVSAPVHSSVSGKVKKIDTMLAANGKSAPLIIIESDGLMTPDPALAAPEVTSFADLATAARNAGLIGLGGAGFPTSVKLSPKNLGEIDTLVLNGAECEPYITSDTRTMLDDADYIKKGVDLIKRYSEIKSVVIGIEKNKPQCIQKLEEVFAQDDSVTVAVLPTGYPQGAEKVLIYNSIGRVVPEGGLPSDVGVIVINVTTIAYLAKYIETGMPLVEKCITVDGSAVKEPKNIIVPVGASVDYAITAAGGYKCEPGKIMFGGPMMGVAVYDKESPIPKNCNAVVALSKEDSKPPKLNPCIHCGRCVSACPMGLNPTSYAKTLNLDEPAERAERFEMGKINLCIECGSCSYVCPSKRPLVEYNKLAKAELREYRAAQAARKS